MAGHSKWANIKHRKGAADAKRSKVFSKLAKYIMVAARNGGGNPAENLRLRYAIDRAKAESMPKDSIERAVKKGSGELQGDDLSELTYEGIGPAGISVVIEVLTDNRNRTGGEIRHLLEKRGGSLGKANSVAWKFDRRGVFLVLKDDADEEELFEAAIEAGAENVEEEETGFTVLAELDNMEGVREALQKLIESKRGVGEEKKWGEAEDDRPIFGRSEIAYLPQNEIPVADLDKAKQILNLMGDLEDHEDVQNVFSDFDIPDDVLAQADE
ncbi:MAG: YebC/PmpR family DNA-binding transcriptional regulator [Planctomycetota bacterium]